MEEPVPLPFSALVKHYIKPPNLSPPFPTPSLRQNTFPYNQSKQIHCLKAFTFLSFSQPSSTT